MTSDAEQDLTNGLIKVVQGQQPKVFFVQGHGERDLAGSDRRGYGGIAEQLKSDNFLAEPLVLLQQDIPADAAVLVVAGPKTDLLEPEIAKLKAYLAKGGKLMVLIDPPAKRRGPAAHEPDRAAEGLGGGGRQQRGAGSHEPVARHPGRRAGRARSIRFTQITSTFRLLTAYPFSRSVKPIEGAPRRTHGDVVRHERPEQLGRERPEDADDQGRGRSPSSTRATVQGPISLAVAVQRADRRRDAAAAAPTARTRIRTSPRRGSSSSATRTSPPTPSPAFPGNRDMFLNMVNWLAQQENLIAVRPRSPEDRRITLTAGQDRMIFWFTMAILPGLVFLAGIQTWWRRR